MRRRQLLFAILGASVLPSASASEPDDTIERVKPSIVAVGTYDKTRSPAFQFMGTGFVVGNGQQIVTNAHVLPTNLDAQRREVMAILIPRSGGKANNDFREVRILTREPSRDLALLEFDGEALPALRIGDSTSVREGRTVYFTGFPIGAVLGAYPATHRALVAAISPIAIPQRRASDLDATMARRLATEPFHIFQLDGTAFPGNSGSPVYEAGGAVIAVINMVLVRSSKETLLSQPSGITYAIPSEHVKALLNRSR